MNNETMKQDKNTSPVSALISDWNNHYYSRSVSCYDNHSRIGENFLPLPLITPIRFWQ